METRQTDSLLLEELEVLEQEILGEDSTIASSLQTPTSRPLLDKFEQLSTSWSTVRSSSMAAAQDDDELSLGASTISTVSSTESVFDRLYRQGMEASAHRNTNAAAARRRRTSFIPAPKPKRLSYTPRNNPTISTKRPSRQRRALQVATNTPETATEKRVTATTTTSQRETKQQDSSVFNRLFKNEKRREKLWKPPPNPTPIRRPDARRKAKTASTGLKEKKKTRISDSTKKRVSPPVSSHTSTTRTATSITATTSIDDGSQYLTTTTTSQLQQNKEKLLDASTPRRTNIPPATPKYLEPKQLFDTPPLSVQHPRKKGHPKLEKQPSLSSQSSTSRTGFFTLEEQNILPRGNYLRQSLLQGEEDASIQSTFSAISKATRAAAICIQCGWRRHAARIRVARIRAKSTVLPNNYIQTVEKQSWWRSNKSSNSPSLLRMTSSIDKDEKLLVTPQISPTTAAENEKSVEKDLRDTTQQELEVQNNKTRPEDEGFLFTLKSLESEEELLVTPIKASTMDGMEETTNFTGMTSLEKDLQEVEATQNEFEATLLPEKGETAGIQDDSPVNRGFLFSLASLESEIEVLAENNTSAISDTNAGTTMEKDLRDIQATQHELEAALNIKTSNETQPGDKDVFLLSLKSLESEAGLLVTNSTTEETSSSTTEPKKQEMNQSLLLLSQVSDDEEEDLLVSPHSSPQIPAIDSATEDLTLMIERDLAEMQAAQEELEAYFATGKIPHDETDAGYHKDDLAESTKERDAQHEIPPSARREEKGTIEDANDRQLNPYAVLTSQLSEEEELLVTPEVSPRDEIGISEDDDTIDSAQDELELMLERDLAELQAAQEELEACFATGRIPSDESGSSDESDVVKQNVSVDHTKGGESDFRSVVSSGAEELNGEHHMSFALEAREGAFEDRNDLYDVNVEPPAVAISQSSPLPRFACQQEEEEEYPPSPVKTPSRHCHEPEIPVPDKPIESDLLLDQRKKLQEEDEAANLIQTCFRMSTLSSAIEHSPHPEEPRFRQALLDSARSSPTPIGLDDDCWLEKEPSDAFQRWAGTEGSSLLEKRAASLAIHNIVRAYLQGLRKYRRGRKATTIQAAYRCYHQRQIYRRQVGAAISIQFAWNQHSIVVKKRNFAIQLQGLYKMVSAKNKFQLLKFGAIVIQSHFRKYRFAQRYSKAKYLALWLQRVARASRERKRYRALRSAVRSLQIIYRTFRTKEQNRFETQQATRIQAAWKMSVAMRRRLLLVYFATQIQSHFRMRSASEKYQKMQKQVRVLQTAYRSYRQWKLYCHQQRSLLQIQTLWRKFLAVQKWGRQRQACLVLQRTLRMRSAQKRLHQLLASAVQIQKQWRRFYAKDRYWTQLVSLLKIQTQCRKYSASCKWLKAKVAVVAVQSLWRAYSDRKKFRELVQSVVLAQSKLRCFVRKIWYHRQRSSVICLQAFARQIIAAQYFSRSIHAAVRCQRICRMHMAKRSFEKMKTACILIQSVLRRRRAIQQMKCHMCAVVNIQSKVRMALARNEFKYARHHVITLQRIYRGRHQHIKYRSQLLASIKLQALVRSSKERLQYGKKRNAAIVIQTLLRQRFARIEYLKAVSVAAVLQRHVRGYLCRNNFRAVRGAVCRLQAVFRGHSHLLQFLEVRRNLLILQRRGRGMVVRKQFIKMKAASIRIQHFWRKYSYAMTRNNAVLIIQKVWRGFSEQKRLAESLSKKLIFIQAFWRAGIARSRYMKYRSSLSTIQSVIMRYLVRKKQLELQQERSLRQTMAATLLQSRWRRHRAYTYRLALKRGVISFARQGLAANELQRRFDSATVLQCAFRLIAARKRSASRKDHRRRQIQACTRIQAYYRMYKACVLHQASRASVLSIQSSWRAARTRDYYIHVRASATMIQSLARGVAVRSMIQRRQQSAVCLQKYARAYCTRQRHRSMIDARIAAEQEAAMLDTEKEARVAAEKEAARLKAEKEARIATEQEAARLKAAEDARIALAEEAARFEADHADTRKDAAAVRIQSIWRMKQLRQAFGMSWVAVVCIQKYLRGALARENYMFARASATMIQSLARGVTVRSMMHRWHQSAVYVQKYCRRYCIRQNYLKLLAEAKGKENEAATKIQGFFRMSRAERSFHVLLNSIVSIQRLWRGFLARNHCINAHTSAITMQARARGLSARNYLQYRVESAVKIQRRWRSYLEMQRIKKRQDENRAGSMFKSKQVSSTRIDCRLETDQSNSSVKSSRPVSPTALEVLQGLLHSSATLIQSNWRGSVVRSELNISNRSERRIQSRWRGSVARTIASSDHLILNASAVFIQSRVRGFLTRQVFRNQSRSLSLLEAKLDETLSFMLDESVKHHAALTLQKFFRRLMASSRFQLIRASCITIQCQVRRWQLVENFQASILAIILIQAIWRGSQERHRFSEVRGSTILIQSLFRMASVMKKFWFMKLPKRELAILNYAAKKIQVAFFLWKMQLAVWQMESNVIILKRAIEGSLVRSAARFALVHMNASLQNAAILSFAKVVAASNPTAVAWNKAVSKAEKSACILIQAAARRMFARRAVLMKFGIKFGPEICMDQTIIVEEDASALVIQTAFRRWLGVRARYMIAAEREAARLKVEEAVRSDKEREVAMLKAEEAAGIAAEKEAARLKAEEQTRIAAEKETVRLKAKEEAMIAAEQEAARSKADEEARIAAENEAVRLKAQEKVRITAEKEAARLKAEEEARIAAEKEAARLKAKKEARIAAEQEAARLKADEEARMAAEKEAVRLKAEEEVRIAAEKEADRLNAEEEARIATEKEAKILAAVAIQKRIRGVLGKREGSRRRISSKEKSRLACSLLLLRVQKTSRDTVDCLLKHEEISGGLTADVAPCVRRLAERVVSAHQAATDLSSTALSDFATAVLEKSGICEEKLAADESFHDVVKDEMSDSHTRAQFSENTPLRSNTQGADRKIIEMKKESETRSTPIIRNIFSATVCDTAMKSGLASEARELLMFGRQAQAGFLIPPKTTLHACAAEYSSSPGKAKEDTACSKKGSGDLPLQEDNNNKSLLFGTISPIKKEREADGWDWTDTF